MLVSQCTIANYPVVHLFDKVSLALQFMEDYEVQHLPVINNDKYSGVITKDDLLDENESATIASLELELLKLSVQPTEHFLSALRIAASNDLTILPVVNTEQEVQGVLTQTELLHVAAAFQNVEEPGALIVMEMERSSYSIGELSRLVETNNASITQLNTYTEVGTGLFIVTIKINKTEIADIIATLQRYDYIIRYYFGEEAYENELKENYDLLMAYLRI